MVNNVVLVGRMGMEPELRYTPNSIPVVTFSLAIDRPLNQNNPDVKETDWPDLVAWRGKAEFIGNYVGKGDLVFVEGRIQTRVYTDQATGKRVKTTEVLVTNIRLLSRTQANQAKMKAGVTDATQYEFADEPEAVPA